MTTLAGKARGLRRRTSRTDDPQDLVDHLAELRGRIIQVAIAFMVVAVAAFMRQETIARFLAYPIGGNTALVTLGVAEPFTTALRLAAFSATILVLPFACWHAWRYVAPAIDAPARRVASTLAATSTILFLAGVAFGYTIALPSALHYLVSFGAGQYESQIRAQDYYVFASAVLISIGLVFQLPVALYGLLRMELVKLSTLQQSRRYAYLALAALAVALPGVDPFITALEVVPLIALYEGTILLYRFRVRRLRSASAA